MDKEKEIEKIKETVDKCKKCNLHKTRTKPVFGNGSVNASIFFIGEAPGRSEDLQGIPFVGRAGMLFDELLMSVGLSREEIFISNILKCRPPKNRNPQANEINKCKEFLKKQIKIINPKIIVTLGNFASSFIFEIYNLDKNKISNNHGQVFEVVNNKNKIKIIPLFHSAVAIYNPNKKIILLDDFKIIDRFK